MNNKCFLLVKNRLISQLGINEIKYAKGKSKKRKQFFMLFIILIIALFAIYSGAYAYGLSYLGVGNLIPTFAFLLCSIVSLFFTIFKTSGELFGYKDFDFLMSIPVKTSTIIASRFLNLYLWNTAISFVIMLPMGIIYGIFEKPDIAFYLYFFISLFIICFIPTTIAVVIGAIVTTISSKFKNSKIVSEILQILLIVIILVVPFLLLNSNFTTGSGKLNQDYIRSVLIEAHDKLCTLYPIANLFNRAIVGHNLKDLCIFIVLSFGWYLLFVMILSMKYKEINTALSTYRVSSSYEVHSLKQNNVLITLYKKELKRWGSCPIYFTNTIIGAIIALILSGAFVILGPSKLSEISKDLLDAKMINSAFVYVIAACIGMSCTTMASISLEGKNVWLLQSLPIDMKNIISSKILVNLTITIPSSIICSSLFFFTAKPRIVSGLITFFVPIVFSLFSAVFGMWINLKIHNYNWESETQVVKQSMASLLGMLLTPMISLLFLVLCVVAKINYVVLGLLAVVLIMIVTVILFNSITSKYKKLPL